MGIEKKVHGQYKIQDNQVVATFPLKLSDFKINDVKYMGVGVDDEVNLTVTIPLRKTLADTTARRQPAANP